MKKDKLKVKVSIDGMKFSTISHQQIDLSAMPDKKMRVYLFRKRETVWQNLKNRRNRDRSLWRKMTLQIMEKFGYDNVEMTFSQKAGCQCGCSPGFIVNKKNGKELFITYNQVKK
jgi:hypothetical protein